MKNQFRRMLAVVFILAMSLSVSNALEVERIAGKDRYETARKICLSYPKTADTVIVVNGQKEIDALMAGMPAVTLRAPIVLVHQNELTTEDLAILQEMSPEKVIIIGGQSSVGEKIEQALKNQYHVTRIHGTNRVATAKAIKNYLEENTNQEYSPAFINGHRFVDAIAATPFLAQFSEQHPFVFHLYENGDQEKYSGRGALFFGGASTVPYFQMETMRFSGKNRFETAVQMADVYAQDVIGPIPKEEKTIDTVYLVGGHQFFDGLTVATVVAQENATILLTEKDQLAPATKEWMKNHSIQKVVLIGGGQSISENVVKELENLEK